MNWREWAPRRLRGRRTLSAGLAVLLLGSAAILWRWRATPGPAATVVAAAYAQEANPHAAALKRPDGSWKYTNALARETSPYLLLHAHNPVDWYPWGPEALARARAEGRPIFLSVGYSTCYWCHVMERQVFSDPEIAGMMNEWFVSIKVDREERPDLDDIYMSATQLLTGGGGWPNSVFLTPQLEPFYAGTYFPPVSQYGRPGFPEVLQALHQAWTERRAEVEQQADRLTAAIRQAQEAQGAAGDTAALTQELIAVAVGRLQGRFDETHAGFGGAPKFPPDMDLELLMAEYERTGDKGLLRLVTRTLEAMARGGMHDHLGGGFHRYSTDSAWRVPHFEKMLYNQAALARAYLHAYQLTGAEEFRDTARDIFAFTQRVMTHPEGGFYSALDSETDGVEGLYYLWTEAEIRRLLGDDAELFLAVYDLAPMPEGDEGVLYMPRSLAEVAPDRSETASELDRQLAPLRQRLLQVRQQRPLPLLDTKILSAWNGLMIDAYAYGYEVLGDERYLTTARRAAAFVLERLRDEDGRLQRSWRDGAAKIDAFQEDYAFMARGLLGLYRASSERTYLTQAEKLVAAMEELFWDEAKGGWFLTDRSERLIAQTKSPYDGAVASGNSEAAHVLASLAAITGTQQHRERARQTLQAFAGAMGRGGGFSRMLLALHVYLNPGTATPAVKAATAAATPAPAAPRLTDILAGLNAGHRAGAPLSTDSGDFVRAEPLVSVDRLVPGGSFQVAARLQVAPGWHINANPASYDYLIPTTLQVDSDLPVELVAVAYPGAQVFRPAFAEDSLAVYSGQVVVRATLRLSDAAVPGQAASLTLRLRFQACDDKQCLAPTEVLLPLDVTVAETGVAPARLHREVFGEG